jgi:hypothetical protein
MSMRSNNMRIWTWVKVGGAILSGAYSAYSIASQIFPIPSNSSVTNPPWISIGIAFLLFVVFVIWGWGSASWKLTQHENIHPLVEIKPIIKDKFAYLEMTNKGHHQARFEIQISDWQGIENIIGYTIPYYNGKWLLFNLQNPTAFDWELKSGAKNRIVLAEFDGVIKKESDKEKLAYIKLPCSQNIERHGELRLNSNAVVTIEVLSEPKLTSPFRRKYQLSINETGEWTKFMEIQNTH